MTVYRQEDTQICPYITRGYNSTTVTSYWVRWRLTSLTIVYLTVYSFHENIKAPRHWPLSGKFTGDQWIPRTSASNTENVSIWLLPHPGLIMTTQIAKRGCFSGRDPISVLVKVKCNALSHSEFSPRFLTIDTPRLTRSGETWGVSCKCKLLKFCIVHWETV